MLTLLISVAILGSMYVGYRYWKAGSAEIIALGASYEGIPPTICTVSWSNLSDSGIATTSIMEGIVRVDISSNEKGEKYGSHMLLGAAGDMYFWSDEQDAGTQVSTNNTAKAKENIQYIDARYPALNSAQCRPWWFADASIFVIPTHIKFYELP
jgi:hypothetical protein